MKDNTKIQRFGLVLFGRYTRSNLEESLNDPVIHHFHFLIKTILLDIPKRAPRIRAQLEVREKINPGLFRRPANLFELVWFVRRFPDFPLHFGPIEGFDSYLEQFGKETRVPLTVPVACFDINKPVITLERNDRSRISTYQLVVV